MFRGSTVALLCAASTFGGPALASGFALRETSATGVGRAFAGQGALADTAAIVWYNPAGMARLEGFSATAGSHFLFLQSGQADRGSTRTVPGVAQAVPTGGGSGGNPFASVVLIPNLYAAMPVSDRLSVGIAINAPFGLKVTYDDGWFGRYDSLRSELVTYNVQPSVSYAVNDILSVGGGVSIQYIKAELTNALPNLSPLAGDGLSRIEGDDISLGWNLGVLADLEVLKVGLHYRSRVKHSLKGEFEVSGLSGALAGQNGSIEATAPITLPDSMALSVVVSPTVGWRILGTAEWVNWSLFDAIRVIGDAGTVAISEQDYKDSWSFHLGAEHDVSPAWTVRAGVAKDATPTRDEFRSSRVPDGDRTWLTAGATWRPAPAIDVGVSYAHVFVTKEALARTDRFYAGTPAAVETVLRSENRGNVDMVSADVTFRF